MSDANALSVQPTSVNRYELREIIARAAVYKAHDKLMGRDVALKTLTDIQGKALEQFYKESRVLANLHHPSLIEIFDVGEFEDYGAVKPFFVMPLLSGMNLAQLLRHPSQAPLSKH